MEEAAVFGPHLTADLWEVPYEIQSDMRLHYDFLFNLPGKIGMTMIELPRVFPYSGLVPEDRGCTGIVTLAESHCSVHSFELKGWTFIDVFSCRGFSTEECLAYMLEVFNPGGYSYEVRQRGIGFPRG